VVSESTGVEEYIHLKSQEDEFEFMDSTMPKKDAHVDPDREEALSPRGGEGRGEREAGLDEAHNHATGYPSDYFPFQQQNQEYYEGERAGEETRFHDNYYHRNSYGNADHPVDGNSDAEREDGQEDMGIAAFDYDDLTEEEKMQMDEEVELWKAAVERQRMDRERESQTVEEEEREIEMEAEGEADTENVLLPERERREKTKKYMPLDDERDCVETTLPAAEMEIEKGEWASDGID
jgi:hypothetical protein